MLFRFGKMHFFNIIAFTVVVKCAKIQTSQNSTLDVAVLMTTTTTPSNASTETLETSTFFNVTTYQIPATDTTTVMPNNASASTTSLPARKRKVASVRERNRPNWKKKDWSYHRSKTFTKHTKSSRRADVRHKSKTQPMKNRRKAVKESSNIRKERTEFFIIGDKVKDKNRPVKKKCLTCEQDREKEELERNRKESFKRQIVSKLGLDLSKPFPKRTIAPEVMRQTMANDESDHDADVSVETTEILIFGDDITHNCRNQRSTGCYKFNLRNKVSGHVTHAELMIYKLHDRNDGQQSILLSELSARPNSQKLMRANMVTRQDTDVTQGWLTFRVDKTVRRWVERSETNHGIAVKCKTCTRRRHKQIYSVKEGYTPVLIIHVDPTSAANRRHKRSINCGSTVNRCCKHSLYISFHEIRLPSVLQPAGVWANYCTGPCGHNVEGSYYHTFLLNGVRKSGTANDTIINAVTPCCGAVQLSPISMMYVNNDGNVITSVVHDVAVNECGCL